MKEENNGPRLDYSKFKIRVGAFTRRESFYIQKGNGRAWSWLGNYKGDYSVFRATRPRLSESDITQDEKKTSRDDDDSR